MLRACLQTGFARPMGQDCHRRKKNGSDSVQQARSFHRTPAAATISAHPHTQGAVFSAFLGHPREGIVQHPSSPILLSVRGKYDFQVHYTFASNRPGSDGHLRKQRTRKFRRTKRNSATQLSSTTMIVAWMHGSRVVSWRHAGGHHYLSLARKVYAVNSGSTTMAADVTSVGGNCTQQHALCAWQCVTIFRADLFTFSTWHCFPPQQDTK